MKIILPVAGKGERMRPYTNNLPKCLLPVGGMTIIDWIVGDTRPLAPTETIFITGYKADVMDRYLAGKPEWDKTRTVLQNDPQGLGQAIRISGDSRAKAKMCCTPTRCRIPDASALPSPTKTGVPCCAGAGSRGIKLRLYTAIFPPRGPSAVDKRPSRPFGLRSPLKGTIATKATSCQVAGGLTRDAG